MQAQALCVLLVAGCLSPLVAAVAAAEDAPAAAEDRVNAEAVADPGTGGTHNFFDTFMAFLGSSALHQHQPGEEAAVAAASEDSAQQAQPEQGRSLHGGGLGDLAGVPVQDGGQADRVKRTGAIPAQLLSGVINHKLGYLGAKSSHHIHFHNYGGHKCEKPHFSLWEFKKALLHKLLEAAKAIGGGVLALKGKLLTVKGNLVAAKGRKLASKGEELTEFGKGVLAKALGYGGHEEVHTAPSAPSAPAAPPPAAAYGVPAYGGYHYGPGPAAAAQYLPAQPPSGHGYNAAVSLLDEYSRAGFGVPPAPAAAGHAHGTHATHGHTHRAGEAPSGPSATGPAGTLPGNLQAGLLVLQPAPSAQASSGYSPRAQASFQHAAAVPAPAAAEASGPSGAASQSPAEHLSAPPQPLVLAPEIMDAITSESNKVRVRRYAALPSSRRSLDAAMAGVVRRLQGSDLHLHSEAVRTAAARLVTA
ncbi:hypothetical protein ONE63_010738 [Megalurothrips usitatus]|uniref:Uncharacterized protein n=1 Tax=Megalurothrips usitatus TaxID=439358 RepID=A0AAV7XDY0_9NEOP|nr:hypothetical protein ONE63_010738 [Megalurothrips usitatus]